MPDIEYSEGRRAPSVARGRRRAYWKVPVNPILPFLPNSTFLPMLPIVRGEVELQPRRSGRQPNAPRRRDMHGGMHGTHWRRKLMAGLVAVLASGCSVLNPTAFRSGDTSSLLPDAKAFRNTVPMPPPLPRELDKATLATYIVEPGDVLLVQPVNLDSPVRLPADQTVLPDGRIDLGQYGRLPAAGKSI